MRFCDMSRVKKGLVVFAASAFACVSVANASPVLVDFTDGSIWSGAQGQSSFTARYGVVDVTASASNGNLTFNAGDRGGCASGANQSVHDLTCNGDGLGINDDEITGKKSQEITIMFSTAVNINDVELLDLFHNSGEQETALIRLNDGLFNTYGTTNLTGGYHRTFESGRDITMVLLRAANDRHSDYALARISFTLDRLAQRNLAASVPAPPAFLLMLPGLALMIRRRLKGMKSLPVSRWLWTRPTYMGWA